MSRARHPASRPSEVGQVGIALLVALVLGVLYQAAPVLVALVVPTGVAAILLFLGLQVLIPADLDRDTARWLRHATGAMFAVHLIVALVINSSSQLVRIFGGDAVIYHLGALEIVQHWNHGPDVSGAYVQVGKEGFFYGLAGLYWLFGSYQVAGLAVIACLAAAVVPLVYDTTRRLFGAEAARVAAVMVMVLPGFLIWTSQLLREAPIVFFLALAANAVVRLNERPSVGAYAALATSIAVLFTLRANVSLVAAFGLLLGLVLGRDRLAHGLTTGLRALALITVLVIAIGIGSHGLALSSNANLKTVSDTRLALARSANTGIAPNTDISTGDKAARFLPVALVNFGFGPFPWQARNGRQLGGVIEALSLWFLLPSLWRGCRSARQRAGRRVITLAAPALFVAVALSLLLGNYGTVVRERLQVTVFLIPLAAYGWTLGKARVASDRPSDEAAINLADS